MTDDGACVDRNSVHNRVILDCLNLPLGDAPAEYSAFFEQCVVELNDKSGGICQVNGYPVYADPDNGIIYAAVCGASGVAVRLHATYIFKNKLLQEFLVYDGGKQRLNNLYGSGGDGWVVTDGSMNVEDIRQSMSAVRSLLASEIAAKAAIDAINVDLPENETVLAYLKKLNAKLGSPHPDVYDFVFGTLPQNAGVKVIRKAVEGVMTMVHPETSVILGFYRNEYLYLRLPQPIFAESLTITGETGNHPVFAFPDAGTDWVSFGAFSIQTKSPALLAAAYQYAGAK